MNKFLLCFAVIFQISYSQNSSSNTNMQTGESDAYKNAIDPNWQPYVSGESVQKNNDPIVYLGIKGITFYLRLNPTIFYSTDKAHQTFSPYGYAAGNPIRFVDPSGDSVWVTYQTGFWSFLGLGTDHKLLYENGKLYENGQVYKGDASYAIQSLGALNTIASGAEGGAKLGALVESDINYTVDEIRWYQSSGNSFDSDGNSGYVIKWDPSNTTGGLDEKGSMDRPSYISLAHELVGHGFDKDKRLDGDRNAWNRNEWYNNKDELAKMGITIPESQNRVIPLLERTASETENKIRAEHQVPFREYYGVYKSSTGQNIGLGKILIESKKR